MNKFINMRIIIVLCLHFLLLGCSQHSSPKSNSVIIFQDSSISNRSYLVSDSVLSYIKNSDYELKGKIKNDINYETFYLLVLDTGRISTMKQLGSYKFIQDSMNRPLILISDNKGGVLNQKNELNMNHFLLSNQGKFFHPFQSSYFFIQDSLCFEATCSYDNCIQITKSNLQRSSFDSIHIKPTSEDEHFHRIESIEKYHNDFLFIVALLTVDHKPISRLIIYDLEKKRVLEEFSPEYFILDIQIIRDFLYIRMCYNSLNPAEGNNFYLKFKICSSGK